MPKSELTGPQPPSPGLPTRGKATKIALSYAGLAALWILITGRLLHYLVRDDELAAQLENLKGWFFVLVTALILGFVLDKLFRQIRHSTLQLQQRESQLRLLSDNLPDTYVYQYIPQDDGKPKFLYISAGVQRTHGINPDDVLRNADCLRNLVVPEARASLVAAEIASASTLTDFEREVWIRNPDGKLRLMHLRSHPRRLVDGSLVWDGIAVDITERKQAETNLRVREQQLRLFAEHSPAAVALLDAEMRYLVVSRRWLSDYRLGGQEIIGRCHYEVFPEIPEHWKEIHRRCLCGAVEKCDADSFRRADGSIDWVRWEVLPWYTDADTVGGLIIFSEVITERMRAEQSLRKSEELLKVMGRTAKIGGWDFDVATGEGNWTEEVAHIHDLPADVKPNREFGLDFYQGESRVKIEAAVKEAAEHGTPYDLELEISSAKGARKWIRTIGLPEFQNGKIVKLLGSFQDITERHLAELKLQHDEATLRAILNATTASVWLFNKDGLVVLANEAAARRWGMTPGDVIGRHFGELMPSVAAVRAPYFHQVISSNKPVEFEDERAGILFHHSLYPIADSSGSVQSVVCYSRDITERKKVEQERMRLATALEQAAESIVITDLAGNIVFVNPAFEQISGYSRSEAIGHKPGILKSGRHDARFYRHLWETITRGEVWHGRLVNKRKDGQLYEEEATISPVRDSSGKIVNYMAIKLDVTREVELESQFRQAQKMEAVGQLAGGVAHDFNNILAAIMMQAELSMTTENLSSETREGLVEIRAAAERAANLTRQLLLFSRRQVMQPRNLDLNEVVTSLAKMLQRVIGEDVRLQLSLGSTPLTARADAGMLDQVLMNLAINARDAMPGGGRLRIETGLKNVDAHLARLHPGAAPGRFVWLCVSDTGTGIPPEIMPRIFEPFFTTKEPGKGTGLGLATVFGIVKQHGGWVDVQSEPGQGASFHIFIPEIEVALKDAAPATTRTKPRGGTETILLAEDDRTVRALIRGTLERFGYHVVEAANGSEALALWPDHRHQVALLLTDLVMPGNMSGLDLARELQEGNPGLKVIFTSGYSAEIAGREIELRPGENFVQKPYSPNQLLDTVRRCLYG